MRRCAARARGGERRRGAAPARRARRRRRAPRWTAAPGSRERGLDAREQPAVLAGADGLVARLGELGQQLGLELGELGRHAHVDADPQIAAPATLQAVHAAVAEHELTAGLGTGRHDDLLVAVERGQHHLRAECGLGDRDGDGREQVVAVTSEHVVLGNSDVHVQVAGTSAARADSAAPGEPQRGARVDARRHVDLVRLLGDPPTLAAAGRARSGDDLTEAAAPRARRRGDHLPEQALPNALHLPATVALRAGDRLRAGTGARTTAVVTAFCGTHVDTDGGTEDGLLEADVGDHLEVLTARRTDGPATTACTERTAPAEEGVEQVAEATATAVEEVAVAAAGATDALLTEPVVALTCLGVAEHLVGAGDLLEPLLGGGVTGVGVGVQLAGALSVRLLDLVGRGRAADAEQFVEVSHQLILRFPCHRHPTAGPTGR